MDARRVAERAASRAVYEHSPEPLVRGLVAAGLAAMGYEEHEEPNGMVYRRTF